MCHLRSEAQDLKDPQMVQGFALPEMSSRVSHAWEIFLGEQCLDLRLISISCSLVPMPPLGSR